MDALDKALNNAYIAGQKAAAKEIKQALKDTITPLEIDLILNQIEELKEY